MKYVIVTVFDGAAQTYSQPQFVATAAQALRGFRDQVTAKDGNLVAAHPEDFSLYELGSFDDQVPEFVVHKQPVIIARGNDLKE